MIRNNLNISINGEHCESHLFGLYIVKGNDHVDNHTVVDHRIANSYSNELYKGIINDSGTGVFNGKIFVQPDAQKTNAFQSNKNLLLSDKASMNTKPQLEIWADDVKCSHGATTGQIDSEQIFYLRSRGLDEQQAKGMLLYAFATDFLKQISLPVLKDYLENVVADNLQYERS
jgi:Fe-S cluster assembly protein SufD